MKKRKPLRTADATYLHLNQTKNFQTFFSGLINYLQSKLQRVEVEEGKHYCTCGQTHEMYNRHWEPFKFLWIYTENKGLDFYAVKDLLDEFFFRELKCECEILCGDKEIRRRELERSGVCFGVPGRRDFDVI